MDAATWGCEWGYVFEENDGAVMHILDLNEKQVAVSLDGIEPNWVAIEEEFNYN